MYKNPSVQTKSFIIIFSIAVIGTLISAVVVKETLNSNQNSSSLIMHPNTSVSNYVGSKTVFAFASDKSIPEFQPVDTSSWATYSDPKYSFSFKYNPAWKINAAKEKNGYYILSIDPGSKYYNINIYVSPQSFYALDGLPTIQTEINGAQALDVSNLLYGIKAGQNYFTFDIGLSVSLIDDFNALVHTVQFN